MNTTIELFLDELYFTTTFPGDGELQELSGDEMDAVMEVSHEGIYITDGKANTLRVNLSYEQISGLSRQEVLGRNMNDLVAEGVISASGTLAVLQTREPVLMEQIFKTGKHAVIYSMPVFNKDREIVRVITNVRDITELHNVKRELQRRESLNRKYRKDLERIPDELIGTDDIVAVDKAMLGLLKTAKRVATIDNAILILGETGVGKEQVARYIHDNSQRRDQAFIKVDLATMTPTAMEALLFNLSPTGQENLLEMADGGTVFLDEIGEMPLRLQNRLLRLLEEGGLFSGTDFRPLNFRIIASSTKDLAQMVKQNEFSSDLFYHLNIFSMVIPPLVQRKDDIIPYANYFLKRYNQMYNTSKRFAHDMLDYMLLYRWPGNVRELRNLIQRAVIISEDDVIKAADLFINTSMANVQQELNDIPDNVNLKDLVEQLEASYMTRAFQKFGNTRDAAKSLGMDSSTFVRKRQKYLSKGAM